MNYRQDEIMMGAFAVGIVVVALVLSWLVLSH
jgi:hypothetical protein